MTRLYGAARLKLHDRVTTVLGFNAMEFKPDGDLFNDPYRQTEREVSPYAGVTVDIITDDMLLYASYSDSYQPQDYYDINQNYLAPAKGVNYEAGVKAEWQEGRLLTTLVLFSAEPEALGTFVGLNPATNNYYYTGVDIKSEGVEAEVSGQLGDYVELLVGATFARWDVTDSAYLLVNLNNLTDKKYLTSLYEVGYYAAPRNGSVTVGYRF